MLLQRLQQGDSRALDGLIAEYEGVLRRHVERYVAPAEAEDVLQELWLRVWQRAGQWEGRGRPLAWLMAIATNLSLNHLRSRRETVPLEAFPDEEVPLGAKHRGDAIVPGPEEQAMRREQLDHASQLLSLLPADKQEAVRLVRVEGYTLAEAAAQLNIPVGTLKSRLHHAQRMLMEHLEEEL